MVLQVYLWGDVVCVAASVVWAWSGWRSGLPLICYDEGIIPKSAFSRLALGSCLALIWPYFFLLGSYKVWTWLTRKRGRD